jgi:hypothetical protein
MAAAPIRDPPGDRLRRKEEVHDRDREPAGTRILRLDLGELDDVGG